MARSLTTDERNVLDHVVEDADTWWDHVTSTEKIDEEDAIAAKVARWKSSYTEASKDQGYKPRKSRIVKVAGKDFTEPAKAKKKA